MTLLWILGSTLLVSVLSFAGVITFVIKEKLLDKILFLLIGFSAGTLLGSGFFHLLPEALERLDPKSVFVNFIFGLVIFLILERFFYWRHCHNGECDIHVFTYLNLIGDGIHNFIDGVIIAISFLVSIHLGVVTTLTVIFHEIPQELGDFGVLVYGGLSRGKALFYNFLSALLAMAGALTAYLLADKIENFSLGLLALTAGGFSYIASSDLIPEIHRQKDAKKANLALLLFLTGLVFMWLAKEIGH